MVPSLPGGVASSGCGTSRRSFARGWVPGLFPGSGCSVAGRSGHPGLRLWAPASTSSGCWAWGAGPAAGARSLFKKLPTLVSKASVVVSVLLRECQFHVLAAPRRGRSLVLAGRSPVAHGTSPCVCLTARGVRARLPSAALVLVTYLLTSFVHVFLCRFACFLTTQSRAVSVLDPSLFLGRCFVNIFPRLQRVLDFSERRVAQFRSFLVFFYV